MFDFDHEFFRPRWRRVAIVVFTGGWALVEFANGAPFWGVLVGAISLWCAWSFFTNEDRYKSDD